MLPAVAWGLGHAHCKPKVEERANSASLLAKLSRPLTLTRSATALSQYCREQLLQIVLLGAAFVLGAWRVCQMERDEHKGTGRKRKKENGFH